MRRTQKKDWRPAFLQALRDGGMVIQACKLAGVGRSTAYEERQRNEEFALAWADVEEESTEQMEREAFRRAVEGTEKPVYQGGREVGAVREFSDTLLIFMLKARRPERYRDNVRVEHSGPNGGPVKFEAPPDAEERSRRAAELLARTGGLPDVGHSSNGSS